VDPSIAWAAAIAVNNASAPTGFDPTAEVDFSPALSAAVTVEEAMSGGDPGGGAIPADGLLRELFGPLRFRHVGTDSAWLRWNHGTVPAIARRVYDERTFHDLPILADALEDAGCTDSDILAHCRGQGPHVRGCWVVDLLLGKV
jgi:hypothetical protein